MNPDRYTKVVLTIIAAALVWLCVRDVLPARVQARAEHDATAQLPGIDARNPLPVRIVSISRTEWDVKVDAFTTRQDGLQWQPLPVREQ
jgi:hypothetical protein